MFVTTRVCLYDTTLRDGEQMPGVAFSAAQRLAIARALDAVGLPEIELGFAASGPLQRRDMQEVVAQGLKARTLSLARALPGDVDAACEVGVDGVIIFTSLSERFLTHKLRQSAPQALAAARVAIRHAKDHGLFVQFSFEDATRTPLEQLGEAAREVVAAGADRIGLADTAGVGTPGRVAELVGRVRASVSCPLAIHCHDDFGLAVANSLAAVEAGAHAVSVTVNGIGERAGNASLEECALALELLHDLRTGLELSQLAALSQLVAGASGVAVPPHKAVVGANSFRHEAGIHVAAQLRDPRCYEPYPPERVGRRSELVLGKTSGRTALRHLLGERIDGLDDAAQRALLDRIKRLAEEGEPIVIERLLAVQALRCP